MAKVKLSTKAVGSIVKIAVDGKDYDWLVVHQGLPGNVYDASCNGTWLLMKDASAAKSRFGDGNGNSYKDSGIHTYLNNTFYSLIDSDIRNAIKQVKIPYQNGTGSGGSLATGSNGLSTKVFLLSGYEVGWTTSDNSSFPKDGVRLAYFGNSSGGNSKRIAYNGSSADNWWLRSPNTNHGSLVWGVKSDGSFNFWQHYNSISVRPAFILPPKDAGDTLTVTEKLDGTTKRTYTATRKTTNSFAVTGEYFQKITNGSHTMTVTVTDGKATVTKTFTFTKAVTAASITLAKPMEADAHITLCAITVGGLIPADAVFKVEVTNNGKDSSPVWEDATTEARNGWNHLFTNQTAANGFAFNFRVTAERGASGESGYIASIQGGFQ